MKIVLFTKFHETDTAHELGEYLAGLGYDGIDLPVRAGYHFNPGNVQEALPHAQNLWSEMGLSCELISTETNLIDPDSPDSRAIYDAAASAHVPIVKIGFFRHDPGDDYWTNVKTARRALKGFVRLSEQTGVKTVYQTHSGNCLGSNCAGIMHLLNGLDPRWIGAHVDGGHMVINGEDIEMGLAMCGEYLSVIGAKDARHVPDKRPNSPAPFGPAFVFLGQGAGHWHRLLRIIEQLGFQGPITVHTEYTEDQEVIFTVGGKDLSSDASSRRTTGAIEDLAFLKRGLRS